MTVKRIEIEITIADTISVSNITFSERCYPQEILAAISRLEDFIDPEAKLPG
jgi:hypothetical protein